MRIAIIGSGGREHAIAASISKSSLINEIFVSQGMLEPQKLQLTLRWILISLINCINILKTNL